jgi:uncharacterized membrane protein YccC
MAAELIDRYRAEARALFMPGPRMADEAACVASVLLAVLLAHLVGARMIGWAAFTAFVLMKGDVAETVLRGALRLVGTALGAGLALLLVPLCAVSLPFAMLCAGSIGGIGLYGMLTARRAYAWLLFGLTFEMILLDRLAHPVLDTWTFAHTRMLEVAAGTIACVAISVTARLIARREWRKATPAASALRRWHPGAARHAGQAAATLALLPLLNMLHPFPELAQVGVTIVAVMIVPVASLGGSGLAPVSRRLIHRAYGCLAGGAFALAVLLLGQVAGPASVPVLIAGTAIGIVIGRHIENGDPRTTYVGLQFTLAVLVALVPDSYDRAGISPAVERLTGILIGMVLLEPVLLAWHALAPRVRAGLAEPAAHGDGGE